MKRTLRRESKAPETVRREAMNAGDPLGDTASNFACVEAGWVIANRIIWNWGNLVSNDGIFLRLCFAFRKECTNIVSENVLAH
jgi:hypothetical protein